jgi:ribosome-associated protein
MKAEDSLTIDLNGKSSIADYMVVTSGRSQRHVAAVAERVIKDVETGAGFLRLVRVSAVFDRGDILHVVPASAG